MRGQTREKALRIEARRSRLASLYLRGVRNQADLAQQLHVTQSTISRDLQVILERWRAAAIRDLAESKAQELARIDELEKEYWQAWEASKAAQETSVTEKSEGASTRMRASIRKQSQTGNPAFLAGIQQCISKRCQILGLQTVDTTQPQDPAYRPGTNFEEDIDISQATPDELRSMRETLQQILQRSTASQSNGSGSPPGREEPGGLHSPSLAGN